MPFSLMLDGRVRGGMRGKPCEGKVNELGRMWQGDGVDVAAG